MTGQPSLDHAAIEFEFVARHLRLAADAELRAELQRAVTQAARPVSAAILAGLEPRLPNPYAAVLARDLRITVSKRYGARDPGVTITARTRSAKRRKLRRLDAGVLEHPLWGSRKHWYSQAVGPGWFSDPAREAGMRARAEILAAMDRIAVAATRKG